MTQEFSDLFIGIHGVLLSNTDRPFVHPENTTAWVWDMRDLPADGVVVSIEIGGPRIFGSPVFTCRPLPEPIPNFYGDGMRGFPLDLGRAERRDPIRRFTPPPLSLWFVADGANGRVDVYFGPEVSETQRDIAQAIVRSLDSTCVHEPSPHVEPFSPVPVPAPSQTPLPGPSTGG